MSKIKSGFSLQYQYIYNGKAGLAKLNESELNTVIKNPYTTGQLLSTLDRVIKGEAG